MQGGYLHERSHLTRQDGRKGSEILPEDHTGRPSLRDRRVACVEELILAETGYPVCLARQGIALKVCKTQVLVTVQSRHGACQNCEVRFGQASELLIQRQGKGKEGICGGPWRWSDRIRGYL
jgi:hypothetical protein